MPEHITLLLLVNLVVGSVLVGLIWTIQVVHYPGFAEIGPVEWHVYHHAHMRRITPLVAPLMLLDLASASLLVRVAAGSELAGFAWASAGLVVAVFASTFFWQVPLHNRLSRSRDARLVRQLVWSNWVRTVCWTLRTGVILGAIAYQS